VTAVPTATVSTLASAIRPPIIGDHGQICPAVRHAVSRLSIIGQTVTDGVHTFAVGGGGQGPRPRLANLVEPKLQRGQTGQVGGGGQGLHPRVANESVFQAERGQVRQVRGGSQGLRSRVTDLAPTKVKLDQTNQVRGGSQGLRPRVTDFV